MTDYNDRVPDFVIDADTVMDSIAHLVQDMVKLSEILNDGEASNDELDDIDQLFPV